MTTPSRFAQLIKADSPEASRMQANIDATLRPIATALNQTPIMGAPPPPWISPDLLNGFTNFGTPYAVAGYHIDALGYVHTKGVLAHGAGAAANTVIFVLAMGYRPKERNRFVVEGNGATYQAISIAPDGSVTMEIAVALGGSCDVGPISFLAEQ